MPVPVGLIATLALAGDKVTVLLAVKVVNDPEPGVVLPIEPGAANVAPPNNDAFRLATTVVEATVNGAVPVARVDVMTPLAEIVVNAPVLAVPPPMGPCKAVQFHVVVPVATVHTVPADLFSTVMSLVEPWPVNIPPRVADAATAASPFASDGKPPVNSAVPL